MSTFPRENGPHENRPHHEAPAYKKSGKPRRISQRERRRQAFQYWVTVFLAVVFIGTSVGVLILARPMSAPQQQGKTSGEETRLATAREQAQKNPNDPQWPYEVATILYAQGDQDGALAQFQAALKIDPGYLPALQNVANLLLTQKKYAEAEKLLKDGIAAEKKDIEKLNKERKPDEPEIFPDPQLRFLLFDADMALGAAYKDEAKMAAREGLQTNPTMFMQWLQGWSLQVGLQERNKDQAMAGLQIALDAAKELNEMETADKIGKLMQMIVSIQMAPPSGMPMVAPSGAPVAPSAAPASVPSAAPATAPSASAPVGAPGAPAPNASAQPGMPQPGPSSAVVPPPAAASAAPAAPSPAAK